MRAANDVKFPMCVSIASMFIFRIGLSYVTGVAMGLGAIGVWIAMIIDWIVRISFLLHGFSVESGKHFIMGNKRGIKEKYEFQDKRYFMYCDSGILFCFYVAVRPAGGRSAIYAEDIVP